MDKLNWIKAKISNPSGNCVQMAKLPNGHIAVRNSRDPRGPVLLYTGSEASAWLQAAKNGEFDELVA
jgi:hypothetical protein